MLKKDLAKNNETNIKIEYEINVRKDAKANVFEMAMEIFNKENNDHVKLEKIPDAQRSITYACESFLNFCKKNGLKTYDVYYNYKVLPERKFTVDVYVPALKLCIEYDGSLHKKVNDEEKNKALKNAGFKVVRLRVKSLPNVKWSKNINIGSAGSRRKLQYAFLNILVKEFGLSKTFKENCVKYKDFLGKKTNLYKTFETVEEKEHKQKQMDRMQKALNEALKLYNKHEELMNA